MRPATRFLLPGLLMAAGLSACAKTVYPPPTTMISGRSCDAQFDVSGAKQVQLNGKELTLRVDPNSPCVSAGGAMPSLYAAVELPSLDRDYQLSVLSAPVGTGLLSPRLMIMDANQRQVREIARDSFVFHGAALYVGLRIHPGEHYLIIASDPSTVGQEISQTFDATQSNVYAAGPVLVNVNTGTSTMTTQVYSHTGSLTVTAQPLP